MLKKHNFHIIFIFTAGIFMFLCSFKPMLNNKLDIVVLDAGHGGKDPGTGHGKEKQFALDITLNVGNKIKARFPNIKVIYTRNEDVFVPLHERAAIANRNKADLFISIHCNANVQSASLRGTETYVMGLHKTQENLDLAKTENKAILYEENYRNSYKGYNPNSPLAHIMLANYQNAYMNQSMNFASKIERQVRNIGQKSRGVKQAGFIVIWETTMPSVLVETGYLTNPSDAALLGSEMGRDKIATAIFRAFEDYKRNIEKS